MASALPTQVVDNCVTQVQSEFADWTVRKYAGYPRQNDPGQPSAYIGIDTLAVRAEMDLQTGATYADARIVCMLSYKITAADSWTDAMDDAAKLFAWFRAQPIHPDAQPSYPLDMALVEELDERGLPLRTRALWQVTAEIVLTVEGGETDAEIYGYPDVPDPAIPVADIFLTDNRGNITARDGSGTISADGVLE